MNQNHAKPSLAALYLIFVKVGVMTFGGGYAMLPILQREIVENNKWTTEEQLADYYAVGQCTPGIIAVNTATFVGYYQAGIPGGIIATLGVVSAPVAIILMVAAFLSRFMHLPVIAHAFNGVRAGVTALILVSVIKLFKKSVIDRITLVIYILILALAAAGNFLPSPAGLEPVWDILTSPVFLVLAAGLAGLMVHHFKKADADTGRAQNPDGNHDNKGDDRPAQDDQNDCDNTKGDLKP